MYNNNMTVEFENTHFIFQTNFSGDPNRDRFGSNRRKVNIVIPTKQMADDLASRGINVRQTRPKPDRVYEDGFDVTYFVTVIIYMESKWPPRIYWVTPAGNCIEMDVNTISQMDYIRVKKVDCLCKMVEKKNNPGEYSLYANIMYVTQDMNPDPFYERYHVRPEETIKAVEEVYNGKVDEDKDLPF